MRGNLWLVLVGVGVASWLGIACGGDDSSGFKCSDATIAHGHVVQCESSGQFAPGASSWSCAPGDGVSTKSLSKMSGATKPSSICPLGTGLVGDSSSSPPINTTGNHGSKFGSSTSSSGGSSSGGSSSGGSSSGDLDTNFGGSSSGGSSSGDQASSSSSGDPGTTSSSSSSSSSSSGDQGSTSSSSSGGSSCGDQGTTSSSSSGGSSSGDQGNTSSSSSSSGGPTPGGSCETGYVCASHGNSATCSCTKCDQGYHAQNGVCVPKGNNGVGNGVDPQPPGNPPVNDGPGTSPGNPGNKGGANK